VLKQIHRQRGVEIRGRKMSGKSGKIGLKIDENICMQTHTEKWQTEIGIVTYLSGKVDW
jgi:hypothetical protein